MKKIEVEKIRKTNGNQKNKGSLRKQRKIFKF